MLVSNGLLESWRRLDAPFAPALCDPLIETCASHLDRCESGALIVDIGCGDGTMVAALESAGYRAVGVDANPEVAASARERRRLEGRLVIGDGQLLPLRDETVDAVFVFSAFQYMDRDSALAECNRVLKRGGRFAVVENLAGNPIARLARLMWVVRRIPYPKYLEPRHHLPWKERSIYERYFSAVGYEAHHVLTPLFLFSDVLAVARPTSGWQKVIMAAFRVCQRLERRVLSGGWIRGAAWHLVVTGRK